MKNFKSILCVLLIVSLLAIPTVFNGFADPGLDLTDSPDLNRASEGTAKGRSATGKTYTVTATTATGVSKTFTLDTSDMLDHVKTYKARVTRANDVRADGISMTYVLEGYASDKNPVLDTQCIIVPDDTKNLSDILTSGRLDFIVIPDSVEYFGGFSVDNTDYVILYEGTAAQWNNIELHPFREDCRATVTNATVLFNCDYYDVAAGKASAEPAPAAANSTVGGFVDVKAGDYCAEPVKWAVGQGITTGVTETAFKPGDACTQAQIVTFIWRSEGSPEPSGTAPYNIPPDKYYYKAANWAYGKGMIDDYFNPGGGCSRAMAMTYLYRLAGSPDVNHAGSTFYDVGQSDGCYDAVYWAVGAGIAKGVDDTSFAPGRTCTRGQIVTFLYRALVK